MAKHLLQFFIGILVCGELAAQDWSREDSLWLRNVIEGKEELKINEETLKAIREGKLVVPEWMLDSNSGLNINKNIEAGMPDSLKYRNFNPYSMPPAVFAMYVLYIDKMDSINSAQSVLLSEADKEKLEKYLPVLNFIKNTAVYEYDPREEPFSFEFFENKGYVSHINIISTSIPADFNHILSMLFSSHYRQLNYNRKHATAYKNYYDEGGYNPPASIRMTESERSNLRKAIDEKRFSISREKLPGSQKFNGIDD